MGDKLSSKEGTKDDILNDGHGLNGQGHSNGITFDKFLAQEMLERIDNKLDMVLQRIRDSSRADRDISRADTDNATEFSVPSEKERPIVAPCNISSVRQIFRHDFPTSPLCSPKGIAYNGIECDRYRQALYKEEALLSTCLKQTPTPPSYPSPRAPSATPSSATPLGQPAARNALPRTMSGLSKHSQSTSKSNKTSGSSADTENMSHLSAFATEFLGKNSKGTSKRSSLREKIHVALDDPEFSRCAALFHFIMPVLVGTSIACSFLQSMVIEGKSPVDNRFLRQCDICFNVVFTIEVAIRFSVYPSRWVLFTRWSATQFFFCVDVAACLPLGLFVMLGAWDAPEHQSGKYGFARFLLLCVVPQLRLLKLLRYMEKFHLLSHAFILILEALPSMIYVIMVMIWFFASLIVMCEPPENVNSLSHAMWLAILTMSTVGYGDVTPITIPGYIVVSCLVICSIMYTAMAFGLIGNIFTSVWKDRDRILLSRKMRLRLAQWNYKPHQIPQLFKRFDSAGKGELDVFTFREMITAMRLCLSEDRINSLFLQFDLDGGGTIDDKEFVRHLFPKAFHELYGAKLQEEELKYRSSQNPTVSDGKVAGYSPQRTGSDLFMVTHASSLDSNAELLKSADERNHNRSLPRSNSRSTKESMDNPLGRLQPPSSSPYTPHGAQALQVLRTPVS